MTMPFDPAAYAAPPPATDEERVAAALGPQPVAPAQPAAPAAPPGPLGVTAVGPVTPPPIEPGSADRSPAAALAPPPVEPGFADRPQQPATIPVTTTDRSTGTQGIDAASATAVGAATEDANAAAQAAGEAQIASDQAAADLEARQAQEAYGRGVNTYFEKAAELQTQDAILRETTEKLDEASRFQPDRTELFQGDTGALFGISAAISAMAGGWLMGQGLTGGRNPFLDSVLRMIDDNANDQIRANSNVYEELTRRLGSAQAAKKELKARMLGAVNETIAAKTRLEKSGLVQQGAASTMADVQREQAKNRLEAAKLTAKTVTTNVQTRTQQMPNPAATGGIDLSDPKEYAKTGKVSGLVNFQREVEELQASGALADNIGLLDESFGWVADVTRTRSPEQAKVERIRAMWELVNRADWASEPNGQEVQRRLSQIGWPRNDAEIPVFVQSVREALNVADPGGRYRIAARAMGNQPGGRQTQRVPVVR